MAGRATPIVTVSPRVDFDSCSARELLDAARNRLGADSLYALGVALGISPQYPQRWYRVNNIPLTARQLLKVHIRAK